MENQDTVKLLKECDAGAKMAITSIDEVLEKVCDEELKRILQESKAKHKELESELDMLLIQQGAQEKEPGTMAKSMSWMKTNMKLSMDNSDGTVADLITDGCNMGIKSLYRYLNQYKEADRKARGLCEKLIDAEEQLRSKLRAYL